MSTIGSKIPFPTNETVLQYAPQSSEKIAVKACLQRHREPYNIPLVINGKHLDSPKANEKLETIASPHNRFQKIATYHHASVEEINAAVDAACTQQCEWAALPWEHRAAVFLKAADLLTTTYRAEMNALTMLAQSKTIFQAEIDAVCELADFFRFNVYFAEKIYQEQPLYSPRGQWNRTKARGLEGFVCAVGPFNFTSISVNLATAPALMGCGVVWKPTATALPASYLALQILEEAGLPAGVINLIVGDRKRISEIVFKHKKLAGIHFTGSTQAFNSMWQTVGSQIGSYESYPRLVGETGGKDFVFAHPSADEKQLVTALIRGSFEYQGQKCSASSRAYIPKSLWAKIKDPLIALTEGIKMGDPEDFTNFMGAVIDASAFKNITSYIEGAKNNPECEIVAGGQADDKVGYFIRPTIIVTKNPRAKPMVEEIFGPVLTIYVYEDSQWREMLKECDQATPYALTGAVFARDKRVISEMESALTYAAGNFYINDKPTGAVVGQQPFGGARASGTNDKAGSPLNLQRWVNIQAVKENFLDIHEYRYPFMGET